MNTDIASGGHSGRFRRARATLAADVRMQEIPERMLTAQFTLKSPKNPREIPCSRPQIPCSETRFFFAMIGGKLGKMTAETIPEAMEEGPNVLRFPEQSALFGEEEG